MKPIAFIILASAWACLFLLPSGSLSRLLQLLVFVGLGAVLVLLGFASHYWDSNMRPGQQSAFILVCGLGTLASQVGTVLRLLSDAADEELPGGSTRGRASWRKRR